MILNVNMQYLLCDNKCIRVSVSVSVCGCLRILYSSDAGLIALFCPCYQFGKNAEAVGDSCCLCCLCYLCFPFICRCINRGKIRNQRGIGVSVLLCSCWLGLWQCMRLERRWHVTCVHVLILVDVLVLILMCWCRYCRACKNLGGCKTCQIFPKLLMGLSCNWWTQCTG